MKQICNASEAEQLLATGGDASGAVEAIAAASAGICTTTGDACAGDGVCPGGTCYLPPGSCIADLGTPCGSTSPCPVGQFCEATAPGASEGTCRLEQGPCRSQVDCTDARAVCRDADADVQRLFAPVSGAEGGGDAVYSSGTCVLDLGAACSADADCTAGETCGTQGTCERRAGTCLTDADCSDALACRPNLIVAAAADSDGDEVVDPLDKCPSAANSDQADLDADGAIDFGSDAGCARAWDTSERWPAAQRGLGFELAFVLPPLFWLLRRQRRR